MTTENEAVRHEIAAATAVRIAWPFSAFFIETTFVLQGRRADNSPAQRRFRHSAPGIHACVCRLSCSPLACRRAVADDAPVKTVTPAEAAKKIDQQVTVEMEVKSTGGRSNRYLNSEPDYKSADNFTIFIAKEMLPKFKDAKIDDPADFYKGKTIRVTGTVTVYEGKPRIEIDKPDQIKVVDKK